MSAAIIWAKFLSYNFYWLPNRSTLVFFFYYVNFQLYKCLKCTIVFVVFIKHTCLFYQDAFMYLIHADCCFIAVDPKLPFPPIPDVFQMDIQMNVAANKTTRHLFEIFDSRKSIPVIDKHANWQKDPMQINTYCIFPFTDRFWYNFSFGT